MPIEFGEKILRNDDFIVEEDDGDLVQTHKQTGAQFKFDVSENAWVPVEGLYLDGESITGVENIEAVEGRIDRLEQALDANGYDISGVDNFSTSSMEVDTVETNVDHQGNDLSNLGSLEADNLTVDGTLSASDADLPQEVPLIVSEVSESDAIDGFSIPNEGIVEIRISRWLSDSIMNDMQLQLYADGWLDSDDDYGWSLQQHRFDGDDLSDNSPSDDSITLVKDQSSDSSRRASYLSIVIPGPSSNVFQEIYFEGTDNRGGFVNGGGGTLVDASVSQCRIFPDDPDGSNPWSEFNARVIRWPKI